jgi:uncharacterized protein (TIGR00369 family)
MSDQDAQDFADPLNSTLGGWFKATGLRVTRATRDEVVAEVEVGPHHHQAYGIVHGGVHCGIIESLASIGAAIDAMAQGKSVVGMENHTSFLRAVREGTLRAMARPILRGRRSQLWEGSVQDEQGRLVATGRVRLLVLEPEAAIAGERVGVKAT